MNKNSTPEEILKESLPEIIKAAKYCIEYRKNNGGCLGYPAAILLFTIVDSIGSYFYKNKEIENITKKKEDYINSDSWEHFKILKTNYFNQNLSPKNIKDIYYNFRCKLSHNTVLGKDSRMIIDNTAGNIFTFKKKSDGEEEIIISINKLFKLCEEAVNKFLKKVDIIVSHSEQKKKILGKKN